MDVVGLLGNVGNVVCYQVVPDQSVAVQVTHAALPAPAEGAGQCEGEDDQE